MRFISNAIELKYIMSVENGLQIVLVNEVSLSKIEKTEYEAIDEVIVQLNKNISEKLMNEVKPSYINEIQRAQN